MTVPTTDAAGAAPGAPPDEPARSRPWVRALLAGIVLALAAMWIYVLFIGEAQTPNVLDDRSWPPGADEVCTAVAAEIAALPPAGAFADVEPLEEALGQRAEVAEQATDLLARQLTTLRALPPPAGTNDPALLSAWFADWDTYLQDRRDHIADWRAGRDGPFAETEADTGGPIANRMNALAKENGMDGCVVPGDLG